MLLIAGDGALRRKLERRAVDLGVAHRVAFLGFAENIKSFMESIDIFALPSRWEGFGYVLAEAMASRKPIVAFNTSSNPELVADGETGLLTEPNAGALAAGLMRLASDRTLSARMGERGRERVARHFTLAECSREVERFLLGRG